MRLLTLFQQVAISNYYLEGLDGRPPWLTEIPLGHLVRASAAWSIPLSEVLDLAKPFASLGASIPSIDETPGFVPTSRHQQLWSIGLDGQHPWLTELSLGHLVRASAAWLMPLPEVFDLAKPFASLGVSIPSINETPNFVPTSRHQQLWSRDLDGRPPWLTELSLGHLVRASAAWSIPLSEVLDLAKPFASLGVSIPSINETPDFVLTSRHQQLWSRDLNGRPPWLTELSLGHLVHASAAWSIPLSEVFDLAKPFASLGVSIPSINETLGFVPTSRHQQLLSRDLDGRPPWLTELSLGHLVRVSVAWLMSLSEVFDLAKPLASLGVSIPSIDEIPNFTPTNDHQRLVSLIGRDRQRANMLLPNHYQKHSNILTERVTLRHLLLASIEWSIPLQDVVALYEPFRFIARIEGEESEEGEALDPLILACYAHTADTRVSKLIDALEQLKQYGFNVSESLTFAYFCRDLETHNAV